MKIAYFSFLVFCITACSDHDIEDFNRLDPASKGYKNELAKIINEHGDKLTLTFNKYFTIAGKHYLNVTVDGRGGLHTDANILVTKWTKLEGIKRTKGIGYSGAELHNLKVSLSDAENKPVLVYHDLDNIAD